MLLRQQSYAIKNQLGQRKILPTLYFACSSLVLYVIWIVVFHARKGSIIGANENTGYISTTQPPLYHSNISQLVTNVLFKLLLVDSFIVLTNVHGVVGASNHINHYMP